MVIILSFICVILGVIGLILTIIFGTKQLNLYYRRVKFKFLKRFPFVSISTKGTSKSKKRKKGKRLIKEKYSRRKALYIFIILIIIISLLILIRNYLITKPSKPINSIAVLPLENLSGDPDEEYFADGITDELIAHLAQFSMLRVISRTSVMQYKNTTKPLPEIARELNVDAVVEGTVLRVGNQVRITAQLIEAETDRHLFAKKYKRDLKDILALQSEVAQAIAREIRIKLDTEEERYPINIRQVNPEAYEAYLKGCHYAGERTEEGFRKGIEFLNQAIDREPEFAQAYAALGRIYLSSSLHGYVISEEAMQKAMEALKKALDIDNTLAEAHELLGDYNLMVAWDFSGAKREYKIALELNQNNADAHMSYAQYLAAIGEFDEAVEEAELSLELDPINPQITWSLGWIYLKAGRYKESISKMKEAIELNFPESFANAYIAVGYMLEGKHKEAIDECQKPIDPEDFNPFTFGLCGCVYALADRQSEAYNVIDELKELSKNAYLDPFIMAMIYGSLEEKDKSFQWLSKSYEEKSLNMWTIKIVPFFDCLHSDPRFTALLKEIGFEEETSDN